MSAIWLLSVDQTHNRWLGRVTNGLREGEASEKPINRFLQTVAGRLRVITDTGRAGD